MYERRTPNRDRGILESAREVRAKERDRIADQAALPARPCPGVVSNVRTEITQAVYLMSCLRPVESQSSQRALPDVLQHRAVDVAGCAIQPKCLSQCRQERSVAVDNLLKMDQGHDRAMV